ncbi:MAG: hypothetical protein K0Q90_693 [Paenibacillaceae bacterium]|nr:hypothetical protein [Paenibacillaceae bacterium]
MSSIDIVLEYSPVVNFAMQQNHVPVIRKLLLTNTGTAELRRIQVVIRTNPDFAGEWKTTLELLPAGQTTDVGTVALRLSPSFLIGLTERLSGVLELAVLHEDGAELLLRTFPMDVLAYDEWHGLFLLPEMAGAFVAPNHPEVLRVVKAAASILHGWDPSVVFDGYQSQDTNRVRKQAAAVYAALQQEGLAYSVCPASFEEIGQRVRLPDTLMQYRMGNCLDLSFFYAACLEAVGLHPLVIFTKGHAFAGLWLVKETFADSFQDDWSLLTKRLAAGIHEICVVETTALTAGRNVAFGDAEKLAAEHLAVPESFDGFVDVKRARASGIRPIPIRVQGQAGWEASEVVSTSGSFPAEAPGLLEVLERPVEVSFISLPKQKEWERRLLDLTLRNSLLNFRLTRSSVQILSAGLGPIEDAIANGKEFQLLPSPRDWQGEERDSGLFRTIHHTDPVAELLREEQENGRLRSNLSEADLGGRLVNLYRSARVSLEENGANTLYLALGLLQWYETDASQKARYAPLVLIPVDLVRKSSRVGFLLRARDEEPQFNITLLELLKQDFGIDIGGLDPLPKDEQGVDLKRVFTVIRHGVMARPRWDVIETAYLGLFSFSQFVMWNDLKTRSGELAQNPVVASLMAGQLKWVPEEVFPDTHLLDGQYGVDHGAVPISADSSQLAAIFASGEGQSFVLHGPPGTGKSQTITNIIANALAMGKRVLFVAEKMAALNVVQRRLAAIGLEPFCLELHSNKSKKKAVLEQLQQALDAAGTRPPEEWERLAGRLKEARQRLNDYVTALHRKNSSGKSVYDCLTAYGKVREQPDTVKLSPAAAGALSVDQWSRWEELAGELHAAAEALAGPITGHPWEEARLSEYTPALRSQLEELLAAYREKLDECGQAVQETAPHLGLQAESIGRVQLDLLGKCCGHLAGAPALVPGLLASDSLGEDIVRVRAAIGYGAERDKLEGRILAGFSPSVLAADAAGMLALWQKADLQWFLPKWMGRRRVMGLLKKHALPGKSIAADGTEALLHDLVGYAEEAQRVQNSGDAVRPLIGDGLWNGGNGSWAGIAEACDYAEQLGLLAEACTGSVRGGVELRRRYLELARAGDYTALQQKLSRLSASLRELQQMEEMLAGLLELDKERLWAEGDARDWIAWMQAKADRWLSRLDGLRDWCAWRRTRAKAAEAGLDPVITPLEKGSLPLVNLVPAFYKALNKACMEHFISVTEPLKVFSSRMFEESVRQFTRMTDEFELLTRQEIAARLAARVPHSASEAAQSSELGILQRAIRSNGRSLAIRKLFEQIPNLLHRLCPCMLMSPISVAQYLDPANPLFDLVIFDEASQMPTSEAVGAMARGRHVIVVGDPKQLPPTSFFTSGHGDAGEEDVLNEDLESVLDDCMAIGMPQGHLLWHYRSRHESLIAFSNAHYYDNKLLTFPSPYERVSNVTLQVVEGTYDRGKTKQNRAEAEAVLAEIVRRLEDPGLRSQSIGVVTFSSVQQNLIEDLLDEAFRQKPELELWAHEMTEPIFIKNLENVQGDERDVILFSIGYGPDAGGKVSMNFGPLNRDGGWRRLNVAVSRAKSEMKVFSTIRPDQLNLARTVAQGVAGLKAFLEYADKGKQVLSFRTSSSTSHSRLQGIETEIASRLLQAGVQADVQVGVSGFKIDVAIVDPSDPARYILGIVTDGYVYSMAKTARDREILQHRVAEQLGWRLHRVWSLDWWEQPERELQKILQAVKQAEEEKQAVLEAAGVSGIEAVARETTGTAVELERVLGEEPPPSPQADGAAEPERIQTNAAAVAAGSPPAGTGYGGMAAAYIPYALPPAELPAEEFHSPSHTRLVCRQMTDVVEHEGPISRQLLGKRVLQAWGITRSGARIERRFDELLAKLDFIATRHGEAEFYWPGEASPEAYGVYRVPPADQERRGAEDLPPEEIANAVRHILQMQISLPREEMLRETMRAFGYQRSSAALEKALQAGLDLAIVRGFARMDERERVVLV